MRFLTHDDVATLASVVDPRYHAFVLVAAYTGLRAGELIGLRRKHVDLLRRTVTVVEQVQYIGGRHLTLPPKSAAGRRSVAVPAVVTDDLTDHLGHFAEPGAEDLSSPPLKAGFSLRLSWVRQACEGGSHGRQCSFLRVKSDVEGRPDLENFRKRVWLPAVAQAGLAPCGSMISGTPAPRSPSPREPT
ncbi:MAG: tyrosine-type recombinase/integrase [Acidimicrobiales bacterium]